MAFTLNAYVIATYCLPACLPASLVTYSPTTRQTDRPTDRPIYHLVSYFVITEFNNCFYHSITKIVFIF